MPWPRGVGVPHVFLLALIITAFVWTRPAFAGTDPGAASTDASKPSIATLPLEAEDNAHILASVILDRLKLERVVPGLVLASRKRVTGMMVRDGKTEQLAGELFDKYLAPAFVARFSELRDRFEDIIVADFTVAELRAFVFNERGDSRQSAAAKASQLPAQFEMAGQEWGRQVGIDVFKANKEFFQKHDLDTPSGETK